MSGQIEGPVRTFVAGAALGEGIRVTLTSGVLQAAGAEDRGIGTTVAPAYASGDLVGVRLWNAPGTRKMVAAGAVTQFAKVYGAASGKVDDTANGNPIGVALETASAANGVIEVLTIEAGGSGLQIRAGVATLDGTNPTPVTTGLDSIVAAFCTLAAAATPGDDPTSFSYAASGGTLSIYAYKTNGSDPTLVDSTNNAATVAWLAVGYTALN